MAEKLNPAIKKYLKDARMSLKSDNFIEALESYKNVVQLVPNSPAAHHRVSHILRKLKRMEESDTELEKAMSLNPTSYSLHIVKGFNLLSYKRENEGIAEINKAIKINPQRPGNYFLKAVAYIYLENPNLARKEFKKYVHKLQSKRPPMTELELNLLNLRLEKTIIDNIPSTFSMKISDNTTSTMPRSHDEMVAHEIYEEQLRSGKPLN